MASETQAQPEGRWLRLGVLAALLSGLLCLVVLCAWQSDDAYISFRTIRNVWAGLGFTWNPGERVQCYTHPLWLLFLLPWYGLSGEIYFTSLVASIALTMLAVLLVVHLCRAKLRLMLLAIVLLSTSGAFVDYATSGLENPLLYVLLPALLLAANVEEPDRRLQLVSVTTSAICLTRMDASLMALPTLALLAWQHRPRGRALRMAVTGLLPVVAWECFSLVYYGSLVPNTALAKLNSTASSLSLVRQGTLYFWDSLAHDPATLITTLSCSAVIAWRGTPRERGIAAGIGLYLLYVLVIGGDFMSGRFLSAPFVLSCALLVTRLSRTAHLPGRPGNLALAVALALCGFGVVWPESRWRSRADFGVAQGYAGSLRAHGIADERAYYYPTTGLLPVLAHHEELVQRRLPIPPYRGAILGLQFSQSQRRATLWNEAGFFGYFSRADQVVLDVWGLTDAFLARIPYRPGSTWRIGHYDRRMPAGYLESRLSGTNRVADPGLARFYDGLSLVTRGPIFSTNRWREIWRLHTGYYAAALANPNYL